MTDFTHFRPGTKEIKIPDAPEGDPRIIDLITFNGKIYVCTDRGLYVLQDDKLVRIEFEL